MDGDQIALPLHKTIKIDKSITSEKEWKYALSPNGNYIVYWSKEVNFFYLQSVLEGKGPIPILLNKDCVVDTIVFSPIENELLIIHNNNGKIEYDSVNLITKERLDLSKLNQKFGKDNNLQNIVAYTNNGKIIIFVSNKTVMCWEIDNGQVINKLKFKQEIIDLACSNNDKYIAISTTSEILIFDIKNLKLLYSNNNLLGYNLSFTADNNTLLSIDLQKIIKIWNFTENKQKEINLSEIFSAKYINERYPKIIGTDNHVAVFLFEEIYFYNNKTLELEYKIFLSNMNYSVFTSNDVFISNTKNNAKFIMTKGTNCLLIWDYTKLKESKAINIRKIGDLSAKIDELNKEHDYKAIIETSVQIRNIGKHVAGFQVDHWKQFEWDMEMKKIKYERDERNKKVEQNRKDELSRKVKQEIFDRELKIRQEKERLASKRKKYFERLIIKVKRIKSNIVAEELEFSSTRELMNYIFNMPLNSPLKIDGDDIIVDIENKTDTEIANAIDNLISSFDTKENIKLK